MAVSQTERDNIIEKNIKKGNRQRVWRVYEPISGLGLPVCGIGKGAWLGARTRYRDASFVGCENSDHNGSGYMILGSINTADNEAPSCVRWQTTRSTTLLTLVDWTVGWRTVGLYAER